MKQISASYYGQITALFILLFSSMTDADDSVPEYFTFTFENDVFVGEDDGYTNGFGLTFGRGPFTEFNNDTLPDWQHWLTKDLYISTMKNKQRGVANMFFQRMQTPENISTDELIADDLPYVGLLAWQGTMYAWDTEVSDQFSLYLGAVGPVSLGEQAQKLVHDVLGSDEPLGWDNQIENELVVKVELQRVWNLYRSSGDDFQFDILGLTGVGVGNLESATKAGAAIRWGRNLSSSFVTFSLQADRQVNPLALSPTNDFYVFLGAKGGYVFNDIFIDGNTFRDSHSVPLEHVQNQVNAGLVWNTGRYGFVFQLSSNSARSELIDEREEFGAMSVTYRY